MQEKMTTLEFLQKCRATQAEMEFAMAVRMFADKGVGFGWMQQLIEIEWGQKVHHNWGPDYFCNEIRRLEKKIEQLESQQ